MRKRILFFGFFLLIFLLFEVILFFPQFVYIFAASAGAAVIVFFKQIKKRFGFSYITFIWLSAGFLNLILGAFFLLFVEEAFLRHVLSFLTAFLFAFWQERFFLFLRRQKFDSPLPAAESDQTPVSGLPPEKVEAIDVFLLRALALISFYFGATIILGAGAFLGVNLLLFLSLFVLLSFFCAGLFWESSLLRDKKTEAAAGIEIFYARTKWFFCGLLAILSAELLCAVYFLPLPIFSSSAITFLFWIILMSILYDHSMGFFEFKKYRNKLILSFFLVAVILLMAEW